MASGPVHRAVAFPCAAALHDCSGPTAASARPSRALRCQFALRASFPASPPLLAPAVAARLERDPDLLPPQPLPALPAFHVHLASTPLPSQSPPDWSEILTYFRGSELQNYFQRVLEDNVKAIIKPQYVDHIPKASLMV